VVRLESQLHELSAERERASEAEAHVSHLQRQLNELGGERTRAVAAEARVTVLEGCLRQLEAERQTASKVESKAEARVVYLEGQLRELDAEREKASAAEARVVRLESQLNELEGKLVELRFTLTRLVEQHHRAVAAPPQVFPVVRDSEARSTAADKPAAGASVAEGQEQQVPLDEVAEEEEAFMGLPVTANAEDVVVQLKAEVEAQVEAQVEEEPSVSVPGGPSEESALSSPCLPEDVVAQLRADVEAQRKADVEAQLNAEVEALKEPVPAIKRSAVTALASASTVGASPNQAREAFAKVMASGYRLSFDPWHFMA